jgi:hypothetical protein
MLGSKLLFLGLLVVLYIMQMKQMSTCQGSRMVAIKGA